MVTISLWQAALIGIWFWFITSLVFFMGLNFYTIARPLFSGLVVGLILGNPMDGMLIGAGVNLIFMGFISAGGAQAGDFNLAGTVGVALALASNATVDQAIVMASLLSVVGNFRWILWLTVNSTWTHMTEKAIQEGNTKKMVFFNLVPSQLLSFAIGFTPVFLACYYGPTVVNAALEALPVWALNGLTVIGKMLPALGICMNLRNLLNKNTIAFYLIGFLLSMYFNLSIVVIAVFGGIMAYIGIVGIGKPQQLAEGGDQ